MWQNNDQVLRLIQEHLARRPFMAARDVYKLLYQGVRGPEHLIASPQAFTERLQTEWDAVAPAKDDPLLESIRPDGTLLRLNLRPFKAAGGSLKALTTACLETGQRAWGTRNELQRTWAFCVSIGGVMRGPMLALDSLADFTAWLQANKFPAVHHSVGYHHLYSPAYRLVAADIHL